MKRIIHWLPIGAFAIVVAGQDQVAPPTFRTEANYVRVDVFPTRNGEPVADLVQSDFEILDNGVPQRIEQFERVVVRAAGPQDTRVEPNTVRESRAMLEQNPRARVFVLFLDPPHVEVEGSARIRKPLVDALDHLLGPDDLVGAMTPDMSARDVTFARKTTTIEGMLARYWYWGERDRLNVSDPVEQDYRQCYALGPRCPDGELVANEMIDRRREKRTLDALEDLVGFLHGVREERKAVLAITDGWILYRPNQALTRPLGCERPPTGPTIGFDPRTGKLGSTADPARTRSSPGSECETDRIALAQIDDESQFRRVLDAANRANTSFYPIDPRGLPVFDSPIVRPGSFAQPPPITVDQGFLRARLTSLRRLAEDTDGLAIVASNDLDGGLRRVVRDLSSYYLLGYYASGKLDGKFHAITVRVKRPGVQVRARRGYLAASEAEANTVARATARASAAPESALALAAAAEARAVEAAVAPLDGYARPLPIRLHVAAGWKPGNVAAVWAIGEIGASPEWKGAADVDLMLANSAGSTLTTARVHVDPGSRSFQAVLAPDTPLMPADYLVRVRVKWADSASSSSDTLRIVLPAAPEAAGGLFSRRGPATGNKDAPTADLRFRRNEQLRIEVPAPVSTAVGARLLDRTGKPLAVPVAVTARDDTDGSRWEVAQVALAPLAPGDYMIELSSGAGAGQKRMLYAFRLVP